MGPLLRLAPLALAGLALGACGSPAPPQSRPTTTTTVTTSTPTTTTTAGPAVPSTPACATLRRSGGPHIAALVTDRDSGRTFCLTPGGTLGVVLQGSADHRWAVPSVQGPRGTVVPQPSGALALRVGATGLVLRAVAPGSVRLTSRRSGCPASQPSCPTAWSVTLVVR